MCNENERTKDSRIRLINYPVLGLKNDAPKGWWLVGKLDVMFRCQVLESKYPKARRLAPLGLLVFALRSKHSWS